MPTKTYTFYFDFTENYVTNNYTGKFNLPITRRNWGASDWDFTDWGDLVCLKDPPPEGGCPRTLYEFQKDPYANFKGTNTPKATTDRSAQLDLAFTSAAIAGINMNCWTGQTCGHKKNSNGWCKRDNQQGYRRQGWGGCSGGNMNGYSNVGCKNHCDGHGTGCCGGTPHYRWYTYTCAVPIGWTDNPNISNGVYNKPHYGVYYIGADNCFNYSIEMIYKWNLFSIPSSITRGNNDCRVGYKVTYNVDWTSSNINGYKLLDLLWIVSDYQNNGSKYNGTTFFDLNKNTANTMAYDYCNFRNAGGMDGTEKTPNPLCFASTNNMKNNSITVNSLPSILSGPPCSNYKNCPDWNSINNTGGWLGYCSDIETYNNAFCKNFYSSYTSENVVQQPQIISSLNKTCGDLYGINKDNIDLGVCGCFLNNTPVYNDIKNAANLPPGFQLGKPKCFYAPCTASLYQNAGTCPNITFSQCIQNSYPSVSAGGSVTSSDVAVKQVIENCGPPPATTAPPVTTTPPPSVTTTPPPSVTTTSPPSVTTTSPPQSTVPIPMAVETNPEQASSGTPTSRITRLTQIIKKNPLITVIVIVFVIFVLYIMRNFF
jgi:hypothetical protein